MTIPKKVRVCATLEDLRRGVLVGFSGNAKQRKQRMRQLRRLGLTVDTPEKVSITGLPDGSSCDIDGPSYCGPGQRRISIV